jgi:two-component sensor histidine kinase/CheY-like chemotaxis protein
MTEHDNSSGSGCLQLLGAISKAVEHIETLAAEGLAESQPLREADGCGAPLVSRCAELFASLAEAGADIRGAAREAAALHSLEVQELAHRLKNGTQLAVALADRIHKETADPEEFAKEFRRRLDRVASPDRPSSGTVEEILAHALEQSGFEPGDLEKIMTFRGPPVRLSGGAAHLISRCAIEMGRNAGKHGGLRPEPPGRVDVVWEVESGSGGRTLDLEWTEDCGRPIDRPTRTGAGLALLTNRQPILGFEPQVAWRECGVVYRLRISLPPGPKILFLEDDAAARSLLADVLGEAGYQVAEAGTVAEALASIEASRPDAAVLDFHVGEDDCRPVAGRLEALSVRYAIFSGAGPDHLDVSLPEGSAWLAKPLAPSALVDTVRELLQGQAPRTPAVARLAPVNGDSAGPEGRS